MDTPQASLNKTPLHDRHVALGARMVPFAGYDMPVQYSGIIDEHMAVRQAAGLFDVSHMGEVFVRGPHAFDFVQHADRLKTPLSGQTALVERMAGFVQYAHQRLEKVGLVVPGGDAHVVGHTSAEWMVARVQSAVIEVEAVTRWNALGEPMRANAPAPVPPCTLTVPIWNGKLSTMPRMMEDNA